MTEQESRCVVTTEVNSWVGTPYLLKGGVKGAGCDCGTLLIETFVAAGKVTREEITAAMFDAGVDFYSHDWFHHTSDQKYMRVLMRFASLVFKGRCFACVKARPGSIVLTKAAQSERWNHGGVVLAWPKIVHAVQPRVAIVDASRDPMWAGKEIAIFDFWREE
jgi:cell wall-associated NlpC family hydrolase